MLLSKLHYYGIRDLIGFNYWFSSYLSNRKQSVSINGFNYRTQSLGYGVPQGSVSPSPPPPPFCL